MRRTLDIVCCLLLLHLPCACGSVTPSDARRSHVTFRVLGLQKTPSGATWRGWPDKVTESLEGAHPATTVEWSYDQDLVSVTYDPQATSEAGIKAAIEELGYKVERASAPSAAAAPAVSLEVPADAPEFFRDAVKRARAAQKPVVVSFSADWCGPCKRMKQETYADGAVARLLARCEFVAVDLDAHPSLGKFYGVASVPYVLLVASSNTITERLNAFEPPRAFEARLKRLLEYQ